jgi:CheY-like chemotaxis protein
MRCGRCEAVFRVRPPAEAPAPEAAASPPLPKKEIPATQPSAEREAERPQPTPQPQAVDRERLVLVAMPDVELAKQTAAILEERGLHTSMVHDGVEAMLEVQRQLPRVVVLSASLPKMYGFQICEVMKRNDSLRSISVVLSGSIYHTGRYRREPNELYGADAYLEDPDLPGGLLPILEKIGIPTSPAAAPPSEPSPPPPISAAAPSPGPVSTTPPEPRPGPPSEPPPQAPPEVAPAAAEPEEPVLPAAEPPAAPKESLPAAVPAPAPAQDHDGLAEERAKAERLARIIVSDIILYNEDKFAEALRQDCVVEMMSPDLEEGRDLFRSRIDERVREERDHLVEELLRVARQRGSV